MSVILFYNIINTTHSIYMIILFFTELFKEKENYTNYKRFKIKLIIDNYLIRTK